MTWIKDIFPDWETVKAGILTLVTFGTPAGWLYLLITGPLKGAFDWIKSLFPSWDDISQLVKDGIGFVGEAGDWLKGIIMKPIKGVMTWIKGLFPSWEDMKEKFMSDLGMLQEGASWLLGIIAKPFKGIFDFIMRIFDFDFMGMIKGIMPTKLFKWMFGKKEDNLAQEIQDQIAHEKEQIAGGDTKGGVVGWRYERDERLIELEAQLAELSQNGKTGTTNIVTVDNAPKTVSTTSTSSSYSTQKGTTPPDITQKNVAMTMRGM